MRKPFIVGFDGSAASQAALQFTTKLAHDTGADVIAAHVYQVPAPLTTAGYGAVSVAVADVPDFQAAARRGAERILERAGGATDRICLPGGSVARELHGLAVAHEAALLAVGLTHRGRLGRVVPGSIGERIIHGSQCPVLVVPPTDGDREIRTIGVAYDGKPEAATALLAASAIAHLLGASLVVFTAVADESEVDALQMGLETAGRVRTRVLVGDAGPAIVRACAEDVDLLATGARDHGAITNVILGSTSRHLVDHAPCPVMVVPPTARPSIVE